MFRNEITTLVALHKSKACCVISFILFILSSGISCISIDRPESCILPQPKEVTCGKGYFSLSGRTVLAVENSEQVAVARYFADLLGKSAGFTPMVIETNGGDVHFVSDSSMKPESYSVHVTRNDIVIKAADKAGFFYAIQSIRMSLPAKMKSANKAGGEEYRIPVMKIYDEPRFSYRGFMLDVARYFMPKEELMKMIDCMAMLKLNNLHLHLTDDNGWRLEIKRYPRLTEVGSQRADRGNIPFPNRRNQYPGETTQEGGYYTQADMKQIVAYAAQRNINIIPEIDMPAHSNAAIAAYPELTCPVVDKPLSVLPGLGGDHADIIYCAGKEETFHFIEGVLDEVMSIFPSQYIHIGGDEAWKTYWRKCPLCKKRMKQNGLEHVEDLQGYFMNRVAKYLQSNGRQVLGWDEICNSRIPDGAVVLGWQGNGKAALKAAAQGHNIIMTPAKTLYLIRYQGPQWFEPLTYFGNNTLKDVYQYEPVGEDWNDSYKNLLMGVQASMWTEFCSTPEQVMYQVFPRLAALAEVAWSPMGSKDWVGFVKRLDHYLTYLDSMGVIYANSMYNIQHTSKPTGTYVQVNLECIRPDVEIRYTLDGKEPVSTSPLYTAPLKIEYSATLKAATFRNQRQTGELLVLPIEWNKATGKRIVEEKGYEYVLTNGVRGSLRQSDFEWCKWGNGKKTSFIIDLNVDTEINLLLLGCITNYGMAVHKPRRITIETSLDGVRYTDAGFEEFTDEQIFSEGNFVEDIEFKFDKLHAKFIRITVEPAGVCPKNHLRPGMASIFYFDEVQLW